MNDLLIRATECDMRRVAWRGECLFHAWSPMQQPDAFAAIFLRRAGPTGWRLSSVALTRARSVASSISAFSASKSSTATRRCVLYSVLSL